MTGLPETMRCFVAVELPPEVKRALADVRQRLQVKLGRTSDTAVQQAVRWVAPEGIHLTLKFLGNTPSEQLPTIESALQLALAHVGACTVQVAGLGMFPNQNRPRVIWVGVSGDIAALAELQRRVESATMPLGFPSEQRAFSPHLTLARVKEELGPVPRRALGALVAGEQFGDSVAVPVSEISLMRSELGRGGAKYSRIAAVGLES